LFYKSVRPSAPTGDNSVRLPHLENVEVRRFGSSGKLIEEHRHSFLPYEVFLLPQPDNVEIELMKKRMAGLEKKLNKLTKQRPKKK
jgi:hypothetical protein